jgi:hypothetical protein
MMAGLTVLSRTSDACRVRYDLVYSHATSEKASASEKTALLQRTTEATVSSSVAHQVSACHAGSTPLVPPSAASTSLARDDALMLERSCSVRRVLDVLLIVVFTALMLYIWCVEFPRQRRQEREEARLYWRFLLEHVLQISSASRAEAVEVSPPPCLERPSCRP